MNIFYFSLQKFMLTNPLVRVINSALVTSLLFDFLHFAFKSFACFTARFLVSNRRKRNVTRRVCKIKGKKTEPFFNVGGHHFWQFWKKETSELWFLRWIFRAFFDNFRDPKNVVYNCKILEIRPCGLGSRIRDMQAEWRLKVITDLISWIFGAELALWDEPNVE